MCARNLEIHLDVLNLWQTKIANKPLGAFWRREDTAELSPAGSYERIKSGEHLT